MAVNISVIIPTYNRLICLKKCLASLNQQTYPNYEIIVVDDGSTDQTSRYLNQLKHSRTRVFFINHQGRSRAKNFGADQAKGNWLAFLDDDCWARPDWLNNLSQCLTERRIIASIGETRYVDDNYQAYFPERVVQNRAACWPMLGNAAVYKQAFEQIGGFDQNLAINEDTDLAFRLLKIGKIVKCPKAIAYHQKDFWSIKSFMASAKNLSIWAYFKKKYPQLLRNPYFQAPIYFGFLVEPIDYLLLLASPILVPLLLIRFIIHNYPKRLINRQTIKLFFLKWPLFFISRRLYLWQAAWRQRVLIL